MTAPANFKQADVTRALKGAKEAGFDVARIEVDPTGKIVIMIGKVVDDAPAANEWDEELK